MSSKVDLSKGKRRIYKRTHPYTVFTSLYRFAFLLIIPVIQSLLYNPTNILATITNLGFNILFIIIIVFFAFMDYERTFYSLSKNNLHLKKGYFLKRKNTIPYNNITSVLVYKNVLPAIFNCARIYIDTAGVIKKKNDFYILLTYKQTLAVMKSIFKVSKNYDYKYKSSIFRIFIMALTWSNSITGLLIFAPFVRNSGAILGQEYSEHLYDGVNIAVYIASIGLPPTTAYIAGILVFGYVVALVVQIFRYGRFSFEIYDKVLFIKRGLIGRAIFATNIEHINSITIKQSILMLLFKLKSVYINTIGVGKTKGDKSLLIAVENNKKLEKILCNVCSDKEDVIREIRPQLKRLISFLLLPLLCLGLAFPVYKILLDVGVLIEILDLSLILFVFLMVVWLIFRIVAYKKTKLVMTTSGYISTGFVRMNIIENRIKSDKVQQIEIRQSIMQQITKSAHIILYIYGEKKTKYIVRHLEYDNAIKFIAQNSK